MIEVPKEDRFGNDANEKTIKLMNKLATASECYKLVLLSAEPGHIGYYGKSRYLDPYAVNHATDAGFRVCAISERDGNPYAEFCFPEEI